MADEIDAGRIVAEIVLETQQARENAEEFSGITLSYIQSSLESLGIKGQKATDMIQQGFANLVKQDSFNVDAVNQYISALEDLSEKIGNCETQKKAFSKVNDTDGIERSSQAIAKLNQMYTSVQSQLDGYIAKMVKVVQTENEINELAGISIPDVVTEEVTLNVQSYADTIEYIRGVLSKLGITGEKAEKIISSCFQDVDNLKKYQNNLQILESKLQIAQKRYQELAQAKSLAEKQNNVSEVDKLTTAIEKQAITIKSLEAQFDNTYSQMDSEVEKAVGNYQKQENSAENAVQKQIEFNKALSNKQAMKDFIGSVNLVTTSLRTFNSMVPDTIDGIGEIITQINAAKQNMSMGVSAPIAWGTAIIAGIGIVSNLVVSEIQKTQQAEEEARQKALEVASEYKENVETLNSTSEKFVSLRSKLDNVNLSREEEIEIKKELYQMQDDFIKKYGLEADAIDLVTGSIKEQTVAIEAQEKAQANRFMRESGTEYNQYKEYMENKQKYTINFGWDTTSSDYEKAKEYQKQSKDIKETLKTIRGLTVDGEAAIADRQRYTLTLDVDGKDIESKLEEIQNMVNDTINGINSEAGESLLNALNKAQENYISDEYKNKLDVYNQGKKAEEVINGTAKTVAKSLQDLDKEISNNISLIGEYESNMESLASAYQTVSDGGKLNSSTLSNLIDKYPIIADYVNKTGDLTLNNGEKIKEAYEEERKALIRKLDEEKKSLAVADLSEEAEKTAEERIQAINAQLSIYSSELSDISQKEAEVNTIDWSETASDVKNLASAYQTLNEGKQLDVDTMIQLIDKYPEVASAMANEGKLGKEQANVFKQLAEAKKNDYIVSQQVAIKNLEVSRQETVGIIKNLTAQLQMYLLKGQVMQAMNILPQLANQNFNLDNINSEIDKATARIKAIKSIDINTYGKSGSGSGSDTNQALANELKRLEHKKAIGQLTSKQEYDWLVRINNKYRKNADEQMDMEKRLYNAKKQMQVDEEAANTKALQAAYKGIENKKALGKMTSQQELKQLEQIRQKYKMTADERMELEIKIYNLKKSLKDEEISSINTLADAVTEALKEKYEEQRKIEEERINESIESWQEWEDKTVEAIQGEIDALDELADKQESENKRQEYENKRQQTELQLAYEKDDYNRQQLQKELNRLDKEEAERLAEEQRQAQKKVLEGKIEAVKGQSQASQERLNKQLDEIGEKYDKLTDSFSLKAQAQKFIANSTQKEIVSLIKSYASDYEIAGNTIGDALYNGMKVKMDNIEAYVDGIFSKIEAYQRQIANTANAEADKFWASQSQTASQNQSSPSKTVTVQQTVNFNQPVESPVETRRQLDKTNQALAQQISSGI